MPAEVAVIGAGVNGLATARALTRAGRDVVVYEQFAPGHDRGSSHGHSRIFRLAYPEEKWVRLAAEALACWRQLEAESGETLFASSGLLELVRDADQSSRAALEACGVECRTLSAEETAGRFGVSVPEGLTVLFQPEAGVVYADRALRALARDLRIETGQRVRTLDDLSEPVIVVTAGPWARSLLGGAGIDLPTVETCETVAYFRVDRPTPAVVAEIATGHGFYSLADPVYGLKVGRHRTGPHADPDEVQVPDRDAVGTIAKWARERFGLVESEPVHVDTCFYTSTADERFVLERHGRVVVGSACSGHGFKFGPVTGERLAALAAEVLG